MKRFLLFLALVQLLAAVCCFQTSAQQLVHRVTVNIINEHPSGAAPAESFINGYGKTVSGTALAYHSSHPDAENALLARATRGSNVVIWETDSLQPAGNGERYSFMWLAGVERMGWGQNTVAHKFDLYINGERCVTFTNRKDSTAGNWTVHGKKGAALSFHADKTDKFGDLFGTMILRVPKDSVPSALPLTLKVVGEDAGSLEWYMTFQYRFNFLPRVVVEPVLLRDKAPLSQALRISLDNLAGGRRIEISMNNGDEAKYPLVIGANIFSLPIPAERLGGSISILAQIDGDVVDRSAIGVPPFRRRIICLLPYSHTDIGYTDLQPNVERKHWENIDRALSLIAATRSYPAEARFKWNIEALWPLEGYLRNATEEKQRELFDAIRSGSIGVNALYANMMTGLETSAEMDASLAYARSLSDEHSLSVTSALMSDIPGFTWGLVSGLARSGIAYFASAPNNGDRVGHIYEHWGDKPFYWKSQSGKEKVLMWMAGEGYSTFHEGRLTDLGEEKLMKIMRRLDEKDYPYSIYQLPYTLGDNGEPDSTLPDFVRRWNERYLSPRLVISTYDHMFREFESRFGSKLPTFSGDFTPYWEDGAASTAYETALNRQSVDRIIQGEALWSLLRPGQYPVGDYATAWRDVVLFDEHTWGSANSVDAPDSPAVKEQWTIKRQYALDADIISHSLLQDVLGGSTPKTTETNSVDIYNTGSWTRTEGVLIPSEQSRAGDRVLDDRGKPLPSQRLATGELAVVVKDIPPMSARRIVIAKGRAFEKGNVSISPGLLKNARLSLAIDTLTGSIVSLRWKNGAQLVDTIQQGLNRYLYVAGTNPDSAKGLSNVKVSLKERGKLYASFIIEADAPGCSRYASEIRMWDGLDHIEIIDEMDKNAVRAKEGVHIAFPFNIPGAEVRYDVADGIVRPGRDQLAGSCKNFFSIQRWIDVSNSRYGVTLASADAPLMEMGSINAEQGWMDSIRTSPLLYSYVMNNYWHTNYKADQEGTVRFRYSLFPHGAFSPEEAVRRGKEAREPLIPAPAGARKTPAPSLFSLQPAGVIVTEVKPLPDGNAWLLSLYNPTGRNQSAALRWNAPKHTTMYTSDASGNGLDVIAGKFSIAGYGTACIRVERTK